MSKLKNNKGITLVALIITIIVLLILAMVSIRLVMNGGIIDRANRGVKAYSDSEVEEKIKTAYSEYQLAKYQTPITLETALEHSGLTGASVSGSDSTGWKVTYNGKVYPIEANGSVGEVTEVGKVKYKGQSIGIGDFVNYDPVTNATGSITYSSPASATGAENAQDFDAATYKNAGYRWRVLDVKNGKVRLVAEEFVGPGTYSDQNRTKYYLKGQSGYINGVSELNNISAIFGHGVGAESATSMTIEDVNALTGYNPTTAQYGKNNFYEYGNKVTYTRGEGSALSSSATNGQTWSGNQSTFKYYNGTAFVDLTGSTTITSTGYWYNPTTLRDEGFVAPEVGVNADGSFNTVFEMLFGKYNAGNEQNGYNRTFTGTGVEPSYWLASECVRASYSNAVWGLRRVFGGYVDYNGLYYSYDGTSSYEYGVRPVVSLSSSVSLNWNSTSNQWDIQ